MLFAHRSIILETEGQMGWCGQTSSREPSIKSQCALRPAAPGLQCRPAITAPFSHRQSQGSGLLAPGRGLWTGCFSVCLASGCAAHVPGLVWSPDTASLCGGLLGSSP